MKELKNSEMKKVVSVRLNYDEIRFLRKIGNGDFNFIRQMEAL